MSAAEYVYDRCLLEKCYCSCFVCSACLSLRCFRYPIM